MESHKKYQSLLVIGVISVIVSLPLAAIIVMLNTPWYGSPPPTPFVAFIGMLPRIDIYPWSQTHAEVYIFLFTFALMYFLLWFIYTKMLKRHKKRKS